MRSVIICLSTLGSGRHSALRRVVMGAASTERESSPDELLAMQDLLEKVLKLGVLVFHRHGPERIMTHSGIKFRVAMPVVKK